MDINTAFKNVNIAVRAFVTTAEGHEFLAQSMNLIRDQLVAYGELLAAAATTAVVVGGAGGSTSGAGDAVTDGESVSV